MPNTENKLTGYQLLTARNRGVDLNEYVRIFEILKNFGAAIGILLSPAADKEALVSRCLRVLESTATHQELQKAYRQDVDFDHYLRLREGNTSFDVVVSHEMAIEAIKAGVNSYDYISLRCMDASHEDIVGFSDEPSAMRANFVAYISARSHGKSQKDASMLSVRSYFQTVSLMQLLRVQTLADDIKDANELDLERDGFQYTLRNRYVEIRILAFKVSLRISHEEAKDFARGVVKPEIYITSRLAGNDHNKSMDPSAKLEYGAKTK